MLINVCTVEGLVSLIFDVMSVQLIMKRKRKGPNTQPGLTREHLLDKYCDVPSPHFIQIGHSLSLHHSWRYRDIIFVHIIYEIY